MLDVADKLGSVISAVVGLLGVVLTAYGLYLQGRRPGPGAPVQADSVTMPPSPEPDAGSADPLSRLHIPERSEWVPPSSGLPPGQASPPPRYGEPTPQQPPSWDRPVPQEPFDDTWLDHRPPLYRRPLPILLTGFALIGTAAASGVLTWWL